MWPLFNIISGEHHCSLIAFQSIWNFLLLHVYLDVWDIIRLVRGHPVVRLTIPFVMTPKALSQTRMLFISTQMALYLILSSSCFALLFVLKQLKANVREMEKVRMQVCDDDRKAFDDQVAPVKEEVIQAVVKVIELCGVESSPLEPPIMTQSLTESLLGTDEGLRSRFRHTNSLEGMYDDIEPHQTFSLW